MKFRILTTFCLLLSPALTTLALNENPGEAFMHKGRPERVDLNEGHFFEEITS